MQLGEVVFTGLIPTEICLIRPIALYLPPIYAFPTLRRAKELREGEVFLLLTKANAARIIKYHHIQFYQEEQNWYETSSHHIRLNFSATP